jgi:ABC-type antimicrobial peptide transport system permease subunit
VVKNFNMQSLYSPIEPVIFWMLPEGTHMVYVRTMPGQTDEALASLEGVFKQFNPEYPFDYRFLDQEFEAAYRSEAVLGKLSNLFALIAIFISCLGLLGLVSFSAEQRTKEIGVRKVMGASLPHLVRLLTGEVTILVVVAIVIAVPISYVAIRAWLSKFAYHMDIGFGMFLAAAVLAVAIAWLTVSYQAIKAALVDPVKSLRYE